MKFIYYLIFLFGFIINNQCKSQILTSELDTMSGEGF